ncbi:DUF2993 domain-containing protein [Pleurocapsales cyanobacterium LEGE 06147]|nr:DUF2993 domain-containing protein [Pleurocapsales cyanobacterium LEGE 06147]
MELLTILLSGLLSVLSPGGAVVDLLIDNTVGSRLTAIEKSAIRIDNAPNYQIIKGKVERIRIASRGVELQPGFRIDTLELETDPIDLDIQNLARGNLSELRKSLRQPLQGAVRLVITEKDIDRALKLPAIQEQLQESLNDLIASRTGSSVLSYTLLEPQIKLLDRNRLGIEAKLRRSGTQSPAQTLDLKLEWGIKLVAGKKIQLVEPKGTIDERPISTRLLTGFTQGVSNRLDLGNLEATGIIARLLQLEINQQEIKLAVFARMETQKAVSSSQNR